jgi:hypothetical protein
MRHVVDTIRGQGASRAIHAVPEHAVRRAAGRVARGWREGVADCGCARCGRGLQVGRAHGTARTQRRCCTERSSTAAPCRCVWPASRACFWTATTCFRSSSSTRGCVGRGPRSPLTARARVYAGGTPERLHDVLAYSPRLHCGHPAARPRAADHLPRTSQGALPPASTRLIRALHTDIRQGVRFQVAMSHPGACHVLAH